MSGPQNVTFCGVAIHKCFSQSKLNILLNIVAIDNLDLIEP